MKASELRQWIVRPVLLYLQPEIPFSEVAVELLMGTAAQESHLEYLDQMTPGPGPAYGLWQMEEFTYDDLLENWLPYRPSLAEKTDRLFADWPSGVAQLRTNLAYCCAMVRCFYRRVPEPFPKDVKDIEGLARYWKRYYNTEAGKGTTAEFVKNYNRFAL